MRSSTILAISAFSILPPHFGTSERAYTLLSGLACKFDVIVLQSTYAQIKQAAFPPLPIPRLRIIRLGPSLRVAQILNPLLLIVALRLVLSQRPAVIICEHLYAAIPSLLLHWISGVPLVLDEHNVEYVRLLRMERASHTLVKWMEKLTVHAAAHVLCVSECDKLKLVSLGVALDKITVVPNGVDMDRYRSSPSARAALRYALAIAAEERVVLFFGKLDYPPNREAVRIIVDELIPRMSKICPSVRIVICGYKPPVPQYLHPQVLYTGFVERIEDYINASDVVIAPLLSGGGTKLKVVQAIACGKPVVATAIGAEGIDAPPGFLCIADDWDLFAQMTIDAASSATALPAQVLDGFRVDYSTARMIERALYGIGQGMRANPSSAGSAAAS